jgi:hypothetical protein
MKRCSLIALGLALFSIVMAAQTRPVMVVNVPTTGEGVELPYDLKQLHAQLVAEFKVLLGKDFSVAAEAPSAAEGTVYTLDTAIVAWRPGNAAKRFLVGFGSGREASDVQYQLVDGSGRKVVDRKDTIRTNFFSQGAGSTGTLAHPIAQKVADRIKDAKLK